MLKMMIVIVFVLLCAETHLVLGCGEALISGGSNRVCDSQLTASSMLDARHQAYYSRLHHHATPHVVAGSWVTGHNRLNEWIQVNFGKLVKVTSIATQGRNEFHQWVKSYLVKYSTDCSSWTNYAEGGATREFVGNWDKDTVQKHLLNTPFTARCVRVYPRSWHWYMSMRWELYGCVVSGSASNCEMDRCQQQCQIKHG